jgi:hypothetical protein
VELRTYYGTSPGVLVEYCPPGSKVAQWAFGTMEPVPARFGLISGDVLQSVRSSLDYLVWELVIANGEKPGKHNAFPIALTVEAYEGDIKNAKDSKA